MLILYSAEQYLVKQRSSSCEDTESLALRDFVLSEALFDEGPSLGPLRRERLLWSLAVLLESAYLGYELDLILSSTGLPTGVFIYA